MALIISWVKQNLLEVVIVILIIAVATFLRFYHLSNYMTFLGDEGRDALIIKDILVNHVIPSIGPPSSVGNIYLGPLYYYMMAVSMAIFWLNPVAAAGTVALIGVLTVALIYYLTRVWFGVYSAILASTLYALSFVTITYSRSSWNPNPVPFFALLAVLGLHLARQNKNFLWFILTGISLASAVQMHYLSLILLPIFGVLWVFEADYQRKLLKYRYFISGTILAIASFIMVLLPLILFDFRHDFLNYRGLVTLLIQGDSSIGFNLFTSLGKILPVYNDKLIGRYLSAENFLVTQFVAILAIIPLFFSQRKWPILALGVWLLVGLLGVSLFRLEIYDHYLGFLSPVPFLLLGAFVSILANKWKIAAVIVLILTLGFLNLQKNPLLKPANNQLLRTQEISKFIIKEAGNKPFNFALIAERNYDSAYQFFLDLYGYKSKVVPIEITDQLFVVCEDVVCSPVGNSKYEIAGFGMSKIDTMDIIDGLKIYKLVANPSGQPPK